MVYDKFVACANPLPVTALKPPRSNLAPLFACIAAVPMSLRVQATTLTLVTFLVTLGILLWPADRRVPQQQPLIVQPAITHRVDFQAPPAVSPARERPRAASADPPVSEVRPTVAQVEEAKAQYFSTVPVPAYVVLGPAPDQSGQTLTLRNSSSRPLDVSVTASNPHTGHEASAQVNLPPFSDVPIDVAQFLVEKGDLLTLHGPPFADREIDTDSDSVF
jgi:hypothetical protein